VTTKFVDSKGRVTLGERFANRTVIIEDVDETEVRITLARVIPEREAWLYANPKAKAAVLKGLAQAKARRFAKAPDLAADADLAGRLDDGAD
jgi:predicted Fe-S protein YdhL (DUF1289 family)